MSAMTGVKEETTGLIRTDNYIPGVGYAHTVDFTQAERGSDMWLFGKTVDIQNTIDKLIVLLSPAANTRTWYEIDPDNYRMTVYSSIPTQISYRLTAPRFDHALWSNYNDNPESTGFLLDDNELSGKGELTPDPVADFSQYEFEEVANGYQLKNENGTVVAGFEAIANLIAANIKVGALDAKDIMTEGFVAFQGTIDNLLVTSGLVSPNIQTSVISPLAEETDVTIQIGNIATDSGKLSVENALGEEVALIDVEGNASFSGELTATRIVADEIIGGNTMTREEIEALLAQAESDQQVINDSTITDVNTASESMSSEELTVSRLFVTETLATTSISITNTITLGNDMVISSSTLDESVNSIDTIARPLALQSLAMAPVEIMAGKVTIDTDGNMTILGNLNVAGKIEANVLGLQAQTPEQKLLELQNAEGAIVASVDASGSAVFDGIETKTIKGTEEARGAVDILPAQETIRIEKTWNSTPSAVLVSPSYRTQAWVTDISETGFTINVSETPAEGIQKLFWWAIW